MGKCFLACSQLTTNLVFIEVLHGPNLHICILSKCQETLIFDPDLAQMCTNIKNKAVKSEFYDDYFYNEMITYANNFIALCAYVINLSNTKIIIQKCFE